MLLVADAYLWSETSECVRTPKRLLRNVAHRAIRQTHGTFNVTPEIQAILQITDDEKRRLDHTIADALTKSRQRETD